MNQIQIFRRLELDKFFRLEQHKKPFISIRICQFAVHVTESMVEAPEIGTRDPKNSIKNPTVCLFLRCSRLRDGTRRFSFFP